MKFSRWLTLSTALAASFYAPSVLAGETVMYAPPPSWVERAPQPTSTKQTPVILLDEQQMVEAGKLTTFTDRAVRLDTPQSLNEAGTLAISWLPDKGDLTVHEIAIIRDGAVIDVLAQGAKFDVLRREAQLERRILNGILTATVTVPGLRVRDILRFSYSVSQSDQVLGKQVQSVASLPAAPFDTQFGRLRMLWPDQSNVQWKLTDGVEAVHGEANGFKTIEIKLPLAERPKMPDDAPVRYNLPAMLQVGTFANWQEVSQVMAPYYDTKGTVKAGGSIAAQISRIKAAHKGPLAQAVAALRVVQDDIAYQLNGMDGGNYRPQTPSETWSNLYGDCKAKTFLLLAMLHELGIEAEAVAVSARAGDAVATLLPMAAAFDHVLVKAQIGGVTYWLDGTDSGASLSNVSVVPRFQYALPLRTEGADLLKIEPRPLSEPSSVLKLTYDYGLGIDLPYIFDLEVVFTGSPVGQMRQWGQLNDDQKFEFMKGLAYEVVGTSYPYDGGFSYDDKANTVTLRVAGVGESGWTRDGSEFTLKPKTSSSKFSFKPDRSRAAWREIPVALDAADANLEQVNILLPVETSAFKITGSQSLNEEIAGYKIARAVTLSGKTVRIDEKFSAPGGEMPAAQALAERNRAARIPFSFTLRTSSEAAQSSVAALDGNLARYKRLEDALTQAIAKDEDNVDTLYARARFRNAVLNWQGAIDDVQAAVDKEPTQQGYWSLSNLYRQTDKLDKALEAAEEAHAIDNSFSSLLNLAGIMQFTGQGEDGLAMLDAYDPQGDEIYSLAQMASQIEASLGRKAEGLGRLEQDRRMSANNPDLTNAVCWYKGAWDFAAGDMMEVCTEAVERAAWAPAALDSRALAYYRLGKYTEALRDVNEAMRQAPQLSEAQYLRGHIRNKIKAGDGNQDIDYALKRNPSLKREYDRYGL